jgi:aspartate kinase
MALLVQKYGGTSVGDTDRIKNVASRIKVAHDEGHQLVVVVSARAGVTNELIARARAVNARPDSRELDMLLAIGEQETIALTAMALHALDVPAVSYTGAQAGIVTDVVHTKAKIKNIVPTALRQDLEKGKVIIVAGFQGMNEHGQITTLGRGGSDLTAIALAAALQADKCEIYTDVDGVYSADPRIVAAAHKLHEVSFEEMLDLAAGGARVLALRSVEYARNHGVKIHVRSSFNDSEGTWILKEEDMLEQAIISGIAHDTSEAKVTIRRVPDRPGVAGRTFRPLADAGINIGEIVQNTSHEGLADISFTLPENELDRAEPILEQLSREIGAEGFSSERDIAKVSVVGAGMRSNPGVAAAIFEALADAGVNIEIISTSSIRVSCVVRATEVERAVQAVHDRFRGYAEERVGA